MSTLTLLSRSEIPTVSGNTSPAAAGLAVNAPTLVAVAPEEPFDFRTPSGLVGGRNPAIVYVTRLAPSERVLRGCLRTIARMGSEGLRNEEEFCWHKLHYSDTQAIRSRLCQKYTSFKTVNLHITALRGVLKEAWMLELMSSETYLRAANVKGIKGERLPKGRQLTQPELGGLFSACARAPWAPGRRDAAMFALLYGAGLRRAEAAGMDLMNYDPISGSVRVVGKNNKERFSYLNPDSRTYLDRWIEVRGTWPGPLLCALTKSGRITGKRLSGLAIQRRVESRAAEAAIGKLTPHDMRRSFVGDMLDAGAELSTVQKLAGHASIATTALYDVRGERTKKAAVGDLNMKFAGTEPPRPSPFDLPW